MFKRSRPLSESQRAGTENNKFALSFMEQFSGGKNMQSALSLLLSIVAVALSLVTTYLSFFDERYTLTLNIAKQSVNVQTGSSKSGEGVYKANYNVFLHPTLILSNRGTRPLVLTDIKPILSSSKKSCQLDGPKREVLTKNARWRIGSDIKPIIIEPGTVTELKYESNVGNTLTNDFQSITELWCLKFTVIDHRGKRVEPIVPFTTLGYQLVETEKSRKNEGAPKMDLDIDYPKKPTILTQKGWF